MSKHAAAIRTASIGVLCRAEPVRDEWERSSSCTAHTTDIEDRKGTEDKLRRSEQELRRMIDAIPQTIVVLVVMGTPSTPINRRSTLPVTIEP